MSEGTEVATQPAADITTYDAPASSELEQWARDLSQAYFIASRLVTTSFVPDSYSGKPQEAAAAIMTGSEVGLSPIASLRSIDIINGVPAMRAVALRALVQSHGHAIWVQESTASRAIVRGRRRGEDQVQESVWTIERGKQLGLTGKSNWQKQPIAMLLARATSELARLVAADVLLGIPYSIEELEDLGEVPAPDAVAKPRATSKVQRKPLTARPEQEPELPETRVPAADPGPTTEPTIDEHPPADAYEDRPAVLEEPIVDLVESEGRADA